MPILFARSRLEHQVSLLNLGNDIRHSKQTRNQSQSDRSQNGIVALLVRGGGLCLVHLGLYGEIIEATALFSCVRHMLLLKLHFT
jgi:hypothetical protein